jgi:dihydroneopterin aldolase
MTDRDSITLKGMRFHTRVGLLPHEQRIPQPLELDLTVWLSLRRVGETDSARNLLDYRELYRLVSETVGGSHHRLLEALCEKIAARALNLHGVGRVRVAARKPHAPIDGPLDFVEVVLERDGATHG